MAERIQEIITELQIDAALRELAKEQADKILNGDYGVRTRGINPDAEVRATIVQGLFDAATAYFKTKTDANDIYEVIDANSDDPILKAKRALEKAYREAGDAAKADELYVEINMRPVRKRGKKRGGRKSYHHWRLYQDMASLFEELGGTVRQPDTQMHVDSAFSEFATDWLRVIDRKSVV